MSCGDAPLIRRRIAAPLVDPCKRVCAFHQQLKNEHRQPKEVMLRRPLDLGKGAALQLGRRILGFADGAAVHCAMPGVGDLEGIGVDKCDQSGVRHQDVGLIDIANDITPGV
jgi:hypothetical protein